MKPWTLHRSTRHRRPLDGRARVEGRTRLMRAMSNGRNAKACGRCRKLHDAGLRCYMHINA